MTKIKNNQKKVKKPKTIKTTWFVDLQSGVMEEIYSDSFIIECDSKLSLEELEEISGINELYEYDQEAKVYRVNGILDSAKIYNRKLRNTAKRKRVNMNEIKNNLLRVIENAGYESNDKNEYYMTGLDLAILLQESDYCEYIVERDTDYIYVYHSSNGKDKVKISVFEYVANEDLYITLDGMVAMAVNLIKE